MHPLKPSWLDGFPVIFYKKKWHVIGEQVIYEIQDVFITRVMQPNWNKTFITLISKVNIPQGVFDYRPISLNNVNCKIIARILISKVNIP